MSAIRLADLKRPPVWECGVVTLICVVVSVVLLASYIPTLPDTVPVYILLAAGTILIGVQLFLVGSMDNFSRRSFHTVGGYALIAYIVIGGMIEYTFIRNGVRGQELALLTWGLALFVLDVPLILGFSVARYQAP